MLWRLFAREEFTATRRIKKLIFLGPGRPRPGLTERFMAEGNCRTLRGSRDQALTRNLRTTFPSLSPVAWSTFATGVNPAKHNIFDFLNRNMKIYVPELSSSRVQSSARGCCKIGKLRIPLSGRYVEMKRKSQTFWKILGAQNSVSTILRVPDHVSAREVQRTSLLSAMCTPDLAARRAAFLSSRRGCRRRLTRGSRYPLKRNGAGVEGSIEGPEGYLCTAPASCGLPFALN